MAQPMHFAAANRTILQRISVTVTKYLLATIKNTIPYRNFATMARLFMTDAAVATAPCMIH
jgi:hypothetical protein